MNFPSCGCEDCDDGGFSCVINSEGLLEYKTYIFSKKEKDRIIEENYEAVLSQYPSTVSNEQKKQIHSSVEETVTKKLQTINKQINTAIQKTRVVK